MSSSMNDFPELDDLVIREGGYDDPAVKVSGIDLRRLNEEKDSTFEVQTPLADEQDEPDEDGSDWNQDFDREELFQQLNYECNDVGDDPEDETLTPFESMRKKMSDLTGDGGVMKVILKHGAGSIVPPRSLCRVHYNAYFEYNDEPFDSSRLRGKQHQFKLGSNEALLGWEIGIATMKRGELARFMMAPKYAYGALGCPPRIPKNSTPLFEIELISFVDQGAVDEFENFSEEERKKATFDQILEAVDSLRRTGNEAFTLKQIRRASSTYSRAIRLLENARLKNEQEENLMKQSALKLYLNMALCDLKEAKAGRACKNSRKALDIEPKNPKALYRLARGLHQLGELQEAKKQIYHAHKISPGDTDIMTELRILDQEINRYRKKDQALSRKMLNLNPLPAKKQQQPVTTLKEPTASVSHLLKVVLDRLKTFKETESLPEMRLPPTLTDEELQSVRKVASELDMYVYENEVNGQNVISVSKAPLNDIAA